MEADAFSLDKKKTIKIVRAIQEAEAPLSMNKGEYLDQGGYL